MKAQIKSYLGSLVFVVLLCLSMAFGATAGVLFVYASDLPQVHALEDQHSPVITKVYGDDDNSVIGTFAQEHRIVVTYDQIPPIMRSAIISVEDQNFYQHWGIDFLGIARASLKNLMAGRVVGGGSTLTQQLSKNLFLLKSGTAERSITRKIQEAMLSIQIERNYTKDQILTMYSNEIFLGGGQYGFAAAAEYYFGKDLKDVTIEEAALLAALPRSPTNYSPILNPDRAKSRRDYAIDRMVAEGKVTVADGEQAKATEIKLAPKQRPDELAPYFVEEIRQYLDKTYGRSRYLEGGLKVYSTLNVPMQKVSNTAVRMGLREYDKRHGWRGVERNLIKDDGVKDIANYELPDWKLVIRPNDVVPGVVLKTSPGSATVRIAQFTAVLSPADVAWTGAKAAPDALLKTGDVALFNVRSINTKDRKIEVMLDQVPKVQGALVAIAPQSGEIKAFVGGYDFDESKFDRATQAFRQTGSSFKPFVYTAAIDRGVIDLEDTIIDNPTSWGSYSPGNYDGKFEGKITIRHALGDSRNIPAVKILAMLDVDNLIPYIKRFGISSKIEPVLPIALGATDVTLLEMTSAYSTFPNDGVRVVPRYIRRITDYDGNVLEENLPELKDVISLQTARKMTDLLQEPVRDGTASKAKELKRPIAGKTGTTNDFTDAWFLGFTPSLTTGVWVGFDEKVTLGDKETGARAALPIWMDMMGQILKDRPIEQFATVSPTRSP
ncbi:MAG TPA: PBP1A family penicillin-binding protein [Terriglobia bacterium]|nr:PBP1A family penicillin-binding protein [Terriglobia bacterium]